MIDDLSPYSRYLDGCDMTEQEKLDFVNALHSVVQQIVDKNLGINQSTVVGHAAGNTVENFGKATKLSANLKSSGVS